MDFHIVLQRPACYELTNRLLQKSFDGILTTAAQTEAHRELSCFPLAAASLQLLLPFLHPLVEKEDLQPEDLQGETILLPSQLYPQTVIGQITDCLTQYGLQCQHCEAETPDQLLLLLESGQGLLLCHRQNLLCTSPSVVARTLPGLPEIPMVFAWRTDNTNPALLRLLDYLQTEE